MLTNLAKRGGATPERLMVNPPLANDFVYPAPYDSMYTCIDTSNVKIKIDV